MKNKASLPYPVLGHGDDLVPGLDSNSIMVDIVADKRNYSFKIDLLMDNEDILALIDEGKAEYTCEVTCPRTYMRRCYHSPFPGFNIEIGRKEVVGDVNFHCYVTVMEDILDYHNSAFNEDYEDALFTLEQGDVLAMFPRATYTAKLEYEKLYAAGSFMVVLEGDRPNVWFDANGDRIIVYLPKEMFDQFKMLSTHIEFNELFHASIVFNALYKSIAEYDPQTQENLMWAAAIRYRINTEEELKGFDMEDRSQAYELAQALLADPYKRMFSRLNETTEEANKK